MDPLNFVILAVLAVLIIFMVRNSRKRKRETEELAQKITEGAYVMTNFGLYGTIREIDAENNVILLETTPGNVLKVHRQTVTRVVPTEESVAIDETETAGEQGEPAFGERVAPSLEKTSTDSGTILNGVALDENGNPRKSAQ